MYGNRFKVSEKHGKLEKDDKKQSTFLVNIANLFWTFYIYIYIDFCGRSEDFLSLYFCKFY